ncbi:hypothetical protein BDV29DRAFT_151942 [Aspergillus leporis]|uniref:Uncharacterized protein n=1 Tax=Aspergillus leporis TaxID=41062 RepID=A0A5N5XF26_9EURO|nr:hypothetical protein BDV29DRAFT_151942 [Aspergillus leporis]
MDFNTADNSAKYNELLGQIAVNLNNTLKTYGFFSPQYQSILEMLKQCLRDLENEKQQGSLTLDADTLSAAMGHLDLGK